MLFHSLVNILCLLQIWTPVRCSWVGHFPILAQSMALWQCLIGAGITYMVDSILRFLKYWGLFCSGCTQLQDNELWIISEQWQIDWSCLNIWTSINSSVAIPLWRSNWSLTWSFQILCWDASSSSLTHGHLQEVDTQGLTGHWSSDHCISRFEHEVCFMLVRDKSFPGCLDENHQNFQILLREYWIVQKCCEWKFTC